jgi:hypothetical protein
MTIAKFLADSLSWPGISLRRPGKIRATKIGSCVILPNTANAAAAVA